MAERRASPLKIPYTTVRKGKRYFEPRGRMLEHGFEPRPLGFDDERARRAAWALLEDWLAIREGRSPPSAMRPPKEAATAAKDYPRGSVGAAWQEWILTAEWRALAESTRTKIWWPAWLKRIEPMFGDCAPDTISMDMLSDWRGRIEEVSGLDAAHKALKVWRAFWRVMQALRYTQLTDPSAKVRNRQPAARDQRYAHGEAMRRVKAAWRLGYHGLACIIVVCWDAGFSPKDARTLRRRHLQIDPRTGRVVFDKSADGRAKTGVAVIGTLSKFGDWLVRRYIGEFGAEHAPQSVLFRMRSGVPYGESRLGGDFGTAAVRAEAFPGDLRQLRDMRRSGVMEAFAGGGDARAVSGASSATRSTGRASCSRPITRSTSRRCARPTKRASKGAAERTKADLHSEFFSLTV